MYHSRAAEALYPFAYQYSLSGDSLHLQAAIDLGLWLIAQQEADGSWKETPEEWTGTTTDQLLMMALAWPLFSTGVRTEGKVQDYVRHIDQNMFGESKLSTASEVQFHLSLLYKLRCLVCLLPLIQQLPAGKTGEKSHPHLLITKKAATGSTPSPVNP